MEILPLPLFGSIDQGENVCAPNDSDGYECGGVQPVEHDSGNDTEIVNDKGKQLDEDVALNNDESCQ